MVCVALDVFEYDVSLLNTQLPISEILDALIQQTRVHFHWPFYTFVFNK